MMSLSIWRALNAGSRINWGGDGNVGHRDLKKEALSAKHILTHLPNKPWCFACMRAKLVAKPCKR
eukprot:2788910-Heterocapsa_arctica.AAC.2